MNKNDHDLQVKVHSAMYHLIKEKGITSPAEVLMSVGVLSKEDYERWRHGQVEYLERVCKVNLRKLSFINHAIRSYAVKNDLKPSWTDYRKWGKGENTRLRFSKSGDEQIERLYATHYISQQRVGDADEQKNTKSGNI